VREVLLFLDHDLDEKAIDVTTNLAADLPLAKGDRVQLQQVIVNLIINSMQALASSDASPRAIQVSTYLTPDQRIGFRIRDSGPGIATEHLDHVFAGFFTTKSDGMGMGLAICQSIIAAHGGEIEASNAPEGGACFKFALPAATPPRTAS